MKAPAFYSLVLEDSNAMARAWISFLAPGGLWVLARREHTLGEEVVLLVQLPDGATCSVAGRVAWIGAENRAQGGRRETGIALEGREGTLLADRIRAHAGSANAPAQTLLGCL